MSEIRFFKMDNNWLSNFYPCKFVDKWGNEWKSVEHYFQANKCKNNEDFKRIMEVKTASEAKKLSKKIKIKDNWDNIRLIVMSYGVNMKFDQNSYLKNLLLSTNSVKLIEGNYWHDNFWGDCYCSKCYNIKGQNYLGKILMMVRKHLREKYNDRNL
jgi:ribA/ribD-fused uncharacterized protein